MGSVDGVSPGKRASLGSVPNGTNLRCFRVSPRFLNIFIPFFDPLFYSVSADALDQIVHLGITTHDKTFSEPLLVFRKAGDTDIPSQ